MLCWPHVLRPCSLIVGSSPISPSYFRTWPQALDGWSRWAIWTRINNVPTQFKQSSIETWKPQYTPSRRAFRLTGDFHWALRSRRNGCFGIRGGLQRLLERRGCGFDLKIVGILYSLRQWNGPKVDLWRSSSDAKMATFTITIVLASAPTRTFPSVKSTFTNYAISWTSQGPVIFIYSISTY